MSKNDLSTTEQSVRRILVALDASPHSVAALRAAAQLAALMGAELQGLFVEDINLIQLAHFPFSQEVGSYTASRRRLDNSSIERQMRAMARAIRQAMAEVANQTHVRWSFQVARGPVTAELLAAAEAALLLSMGRAGRRRRKSLGSTVQSVVSRTSRPVLILDEEGQLKYPLTVLYTGSPAADRALRLAIQLTQRTPSELRILIWAGEGQTESAERLQQWVEELAADQQVKVRLVRVDKTSSLLAAVQEGNGGTLVLPSERSFLLSAHVGPTLVVP